MSCEEFIPKVGPYVDGELSGDDRESVESHLADCRRCSELAVEIRDLDRRASGLAVPAVTAEEWSLLWTRVQEAMRADPHGKVKAIARRWSSLRWVLPLTAAAMVAVGVFIFPPGEAPAPPKPAPEPYAELISPVSGVVPEIEVIELDKDETAYVRYADF